MPPEDDVALLPTMSEEELARTFAMTPSSLAELARTVARSPGSTIEPARLRSSSAGKRALEGLGGAGAQAGVAGGLDLGAIIGEGGMGVVRTATQRSLGRKVAVKTLRPQVKTEQATLRLLREAWVTGSLEHPNIVPVYDLGLDEDGTPIIVLKHIEGLAWSELLGDAAAVEARFGATDLLEHNLRILVQLCNAVSLAHSRGILHRDLKPENVMVGRFGEVYLVDWGIAVSLKDDPTGRMPLAAEATEMAGTPSYMAPEMLGGRGKLDERTDVYLLGATLHELLVGRPPHTGETFPQIVASILRSKFSFPPDVPPELGAIASRAMSRAPEDRYASAGELRQRLEWYLRHRGSLALSAEAALRVEEMRRELTLGGDLHDVRDRVHHLFAEARFGFRQAIRACDDNEAARLGLGTATEMVVVFELERGTPEAAAAALAELDTPPPELARRVAEAMRRREQERSRVANLEKLHADLDPATGRRTRMAAGAIMGVSWTIAPEICGWLYRAYQPTPRWVPYLFTALILAFAAVVVRWGRDSLAKTAVNRRTQAAAMTMFATQLALQLGGNLLGLSMLHIFILYVHNWFTAAAVFALFVDRRFWPSVTAFFAAFVGACALPEQVWHMMAAANAVLTVNLLVAWSLPSEDGAFFMDRMRLRLERRGDARKDPDERARR
ncbi:MAG: serine/threonine protein kinase [Labilithrix sp.]|nr:serine/threonine protein kinase [Labilithrix sp.]MCW5836545.1 serine/threonine protein kinase [Labilithrix sp.]